MRPLFRNWGRGGVEATQTTEDAFKDFANAPFAFAAMFEIPVDADMIAPVTSSRAQRLRANHSEPALEFPGCMDYVWTLGDPRPPLDNQPSPYSPGVGARAGCEYMLAAGGGCRPRGASSPVLEGSASSSCDVCGAEFNLTETACTYRWDVTVEIENDKFSAAFRTLTNPGPGSPTQAEPPAPGTAGGAKVTAANLVELNGVTYTFDLAGTDGSKAAADLLVCTCPGGLAFSDACDREPNSGAVLVQAKKTTQFLGQSIIAGRCARAVAQTDCGWIVDDACTCPSDGGTSCLTSEGTR